MALPKHGVKVERLSPELQREVARMYGLYRQAVPAHERATTTFDDWVASLNHEPARSAVGEAVRQVASG